MRRALCRTCGRPLPPGRSGVCPICRKELDGLCGRCDLRKECARRWRISAESRRLQGLDPPTYPPCMMRPVGDPRVSPGLVKVQRLEHGLSYVGVAVLYMAAEELAVEREEHNAARIRAGAEELARAWGATWKAVA